MSSYVTNKKYIKGFMILFAFCTIIGVASLRIEPMIGILVIILSIVLACIFYVSQISFETNNDHLERKCFGKKEVYKWEWIYAVSTERSTVTGDYHVILHWRKIDNNISDNTTSTERKKKRDDYGSILVTSHISEYTKLLNEVISKRPDIEIDDKARIIIKKNDK